MGIINYILMGIGVALIIASISVLNIPGAKEWLTSATIGESSAATLQARAMLGNLTDIIEFIIKPLIMITEQPIVFGVSILFIAGLALTIVGVVLYVKS